MTKSDKMGVFFSSLCIVHCVLLPVLLLMAPAAIVSYVHEDVTHKVMWAVVGFAALSAAIPGYRVHKHLLPALFWTVGIVILGISISPLVHDTLGHTAEVPLAILGSSSLIVGHFINHAKCKTCSHHHD